MLAYFAYIFLFACTESVLNQAHQRGASLVGKAILMDAQLCCLERPQRLKLG